MSRLQVSGQRSITQLSLAKGSILRACLLIDRVENIVFLSVRGTGFCDLRRVVSASPLLPRLVQVFVFAALTDS